jgi:small subunit ribosomal protein S6
MAFYECTFIVRADLNKVDVQKLADSYAKIVTDYKGEILKNEYWGLRTLAYKINKAAKGHYNMLGINVSPEGLRELERQMRNNEDVVRNLTVRVETMDNSPSAMLRQQSGDNYDAA